MKMNEELAADVLAALGNKTRLRLFKLLVKAGDDGLNVGEIRDLINVPGSTLQHHLATLSQSGLILQQRQGRTVMSSADYSMMRELLELLTEECCTGFTLAREDKAA